MKYILVMLLAFVAVSCIVRDAKQYEGEWVELVDIKWEMRLVNGTWEKRFVYIYAPVRKPGIICQITYPLNNDREIGSKHLMPIQR
jgi:hypothetical protein